MHTRCTRDAQNTRCSIQHTAHSIQHVQPDTSRRAPSVHVFRAMCGYLECEQLDELMYVMILCQYGRDVRFRFRLGTTEIQRHGIVYTQHTTHTQRQTDTGTDTDTETETEAHRHDDVSASDHRMCYAEPSSPRSLLLCAMCLVP